MNFELGNFIHSMDRSMEVGIVGEYCVLEWSYSRKFLPAKKFNSNAIKFLYSTEDDRKHERIAFDTKEECVNFLNTIILVEL